MWTCPQCHSINVEKTARCYSCHLPRGSAPGDITTETRPVPQAAATIPTTDSAPPRPGHAPLSISVEGLDPSKVVASGDIVLLLRDALLRFERWVDAEPRVLYGTVVVGIAVAVLVVLGFPAGTMLGLLILGVAVGAGFGLYRIYGPAFEAGRRPRIEPPATGGNHMPPTPAGDTGSSPVAASTMSRSRADEDIRAKLARQSISQGSLMTSQADGPTTLIRTYPGKSNSDAVRLFQADAQVLARSGYEPTSQSWAEDQHGPSLGSVVMWGAFAASKRRGGGTLTVTYKRLQQGSDAAVAPADPAPPAATSIPDQIRALGELRDQGLITPEEFEAKKVELLGRM